MADTGQFVFLDNGNLSLNVTVCLDKTKEDRGEHCNPSIHKLIVGLL